MHLEDDLRRDLCLADYRRCFADFVSIYRKQKETLAIGRFGEFSNPGISDIDGLVIVQDGFLKQAQTLFHAWKKKGRSYLFPHEPVFFTPAALPWIKRIHTFDAVQWAYVARDDFSLSGINRDGIEYLNLVWATFLMPIAIRYLNAHTVSLRRVLLILKNMHYSCSNLSLLLGKEGSDQIENQRLRAELLSGRAGDEHLLEKTSRRFRETLYKLFTLLDQYAAVERKTAFFPNNISIQARPNVNVRRANKTYLAKNKTDLWVNDFVFDETVFFKSSKPISVSASLYNEAVRAVYEIFRQEGAAFACATPFGFPFYRGRLYLGLRRLYYWYLRWSASSQKRI